MAAPPPIPTKRLEQIATDVITSTLSSAEYYEHPKTGAWNQTIIEKLLKAVLSEATPQGQPAPQFKFAINSTIIQHVVPNSQVNKPTTSTASTSTSTGAEGETIAEPSAVPGKKADKAGASVGRRGMHSATGGYWNEKTDGMWSFKFDGEDKGFDVVLMLIWIAY